MSQYLLDQAFKVKEPDGVKAHRIVVRGASEGDCQYPEISNQGGVIGVTTHKQNRYGRLVAVRRLGIAIVEATGPVSLGDSICVADDQGRAKARQMPFVVLGDEIDNNAFRLTWKQNPGDIMIFEVLVSQSGNTQPFRHSIADGKLTLLPATNGGGDIISTASDLLTYISEHAVLSQFFHVALEGDSNGSGVLDDGAAIPEEITGSLNPIGVAESKALAEGDLIRVFLTP